MALFTTNIASAQYNALMSQLTRINLNIGKVMATVNDIQVQIDSITAQLNKVLTEVQTAASTQAKAIATLNAEISALQDIGASISPALQQSLDNLQTVATQLDALNPG